MVEIVYNERSSRQRNNVVEAIALLSSILADDRFYENIAQLDAFSYTDLTPEELADRLKNFVATQDRIAVEHYWPGRLRRYTTYRTTNAVVFLRNPGAINLLTHRLKRSPEGFLVTLAHELVHCMDGLAEEPGRRVWDHGHGATDEALYTSSAPVQVGEVARLLLPPEYQSTPEQKLPAIQPDRSHPSDAGLTKLDYVAVGSKGRYADSGYYQYSKDDVEALVGHIREQSIMRLVIYFHGGLVAESSGAEAVQRVIRNTRPSDDSSVHSIGFIWKTGFLETTYATLRDSIGSGLGSTILKIILKMFGDKLDVRKNGESLSLEQIEWYLEGNADIAEDNLFSAIDGKALLDLAELDEQELIDEFAGAASALIDELDEDPDLRKRWYDQDPDAVLLSDELNEALDDDLVRVKAKDVTGWWRRAYWIAIVAKNVAKRLINRTDHGVHATIVEEIFQASFVSPVGERIWGTMKDKALEMWEDGNPGGDLLAGLSDIDDLEIDVVCHSAGANCAASLLDDDLGLYKKHTYSLRHIILMAPATTYALFSETFIKNRSKYGHFKMITMPDRHERDDVLLDKWRYVSWLYPSSLLYFISGVLEKPTDTFKHPSDHPIAGMLRYVDDEDGIYVDDKFEDVAEFINQPGYLYLANSIFDHGAFDNDDKILPLIREILNK